MEFKHTDLPTALSAIREIQEGSTQETKPHDEQTSRYRKILDSNLTSLLNDTEKDAEQTLLALERLLECVQHCAQALPLLFLPQESSEPGSAKECALPTGVSSASPSLRNSTNQVPEYVTKYTEITSEEQRGRYKADFNAEYEEYKALHSTIESVSKRFTDLEDCLRNAPEGTEQWNHVKQQIEKEYEESKHDLRYQQARQKFQYLHDKLAHIKRLVMDYDSCSHNLVKS